MTCGRKKQKERKERKKSKYSVYKTCLANNQTETKGTLRAEVGFII